MNKVIILIVISLILPCLSLCLIIGYNYSQTVTKTYGSDETKNPDNPSRGFYVQIDSADPERLEKYHKEVRLSLLAYDLYEYRNSVIPEEKLIELEEFLKEAKKFDVKCIFRAAYGFDRADTNDADSLERISNHISQIAPILNRYKGQIYCVQAGFFGPWGEWHSSIWLSDDVSAVNNRNWLLDQWLSSLDEEIVINVRRPRFIRDAISAGLNVQRLGFHNDGLLASDSDLGTYDDKQYSRIEELNWIYKNILVPQNGGEMPTVCDYTRSNYALCEFYKLKISYLNLKYNAEVYEQWKNEMVGNENAFSYISKRIGYRYYVSKFNYPEVVRKGLFGLGQTIEVRLENQGYAAIANSYHVELVLEDEQGKWKVYEVLECLGKAEKDQVVNIKIDRRLLEEETIKKVGIRISEKSDLDKKPRNCVELVNGKISYEDGVNFFFEINETGMILPTIE